MSDTSITTVQQKLFSYVMDPVESMTIITNRSQVSQLKLPGESVSDSLLITKIRMTLPHTYENYSA